MIPRLFSCLPAFALLLPLLSPRPSQAAAPRDAFDSFQSIAEKNIFNANRSPRAARGPSSAAPSGPADEVVSLVGTMDYEKGRFAFFDSSDPRQRKAVPIGGTIAGFTLHALTAQTIDLTVGERTITLRVGEQLRRRPGADWTVVTTPAPAAAASPAPAGSESARSSPPIPANASETLRRLMEQRRKQTKE